MVSIEESENMYKYIAIAFIFLMAIGVNSIGQIRFLDDHVAQGEEVEMHINVLNIGDDKVEDARLTVYIPELGIYMPKSDIDIKTRNSIARMFYFDIDDNVEPDEYLVRIRTYTEGHWETRYRHIII